MQVHGMDTYVSLDGQDLSPHCDNVAFNRSADSHQTTTFGRKSHTFRGGLKNGTATITGKYDTSTTTGPFAVIDPLIGETVELVYRAEGTGTGKPEQTVDVVITAYDQTSPVADMVTFSATCQMTGDVVASVQT